jgi:1-phosphofructokinase/6-phosphofructokinase 2
MTTTRDAILTLTPNPSIDRTIAVATLHRGEVHRATSSRIDPGGKGINVSRALATHGTPTVAVLPLGGAEGPVMKALLDAAALPRHLVPVSGTVRTNVAVVEPDGTTTKLNEAGPGLGEREIEALLAGTEAAIGPATAWLVCCGSLPPGAPADLYATLVSRGRERGVRVAVDSSGAPLAAAVAARPHLIKPNHEELAELLGRPLTTFGEVVDGARSVVAGGVPTVVVSLGGDGALLITEALTLHAVAHLDDPVLSTVGAGDCLLAGLLHGYADGADDLAALEAGVRWGAAAVRLPGSRVPGPGELGGIRVETTVEPPRDRRLE